MEPGEAIVYASVWVALLCYPAASIGRATARPDIQRLAGIAWTVGCLFFWLHVLSAFGVFYRWSHDVALAETARQTLETTGVDSATGLYLNYLFALLWTVDVVRWWRGQDSSFGAFLALHGFFLFMIVNGAVIFVPGPRRWLGLGITMAGMAAFIWAIRRERSES